jgi:hypothetical protein
MAFRPNSGPPFTLLRYHILLDTRQLVGLLWTSHQPDRDLYVTTSDTHNRRTSKHPAVSERPQTHALDRAVTEIGREHCTLMKVNTHEHGCQIPRCKEN